MKRITAILLCLLLLGTLALTATAAGSAHMSISSSSSSVYRGDTFTLTISLSNDQPVSNGGIVLSYDTSVFELLGGSCSVSNATLAEVSAANGGGVFLLQTDAVVSGTIFTINMKVKSDAAFGSYSISGTPSLSISCGISGTSVTVACKHSFGTASKVDSTNHQSTCSICGTTQKDAHTWDNGTVTKAATCKDTGSKTLKCTACGAEKTETVPVTNDHKYGDWTNQGGNHSHKCSVCGKDESAGHNWYIYEVLEEPTCQKPGRATIICDGCGAAGEQDLDITEHTYGTPTGVTATTHTHKCTVCGTVTTADHTFGEEWEHDKTMHYYACQVCGYKKDQEEHNPGPKATEETDQVCTVCNRILRPKGAHKHEYLEDWASDETNHWHDCVDCPVRDSEMPHVFDSDCDAQCNVCKYTRKVTHYPIPVLSSDETGHWYPCVFCGEKLDFAAHTPGPEASIAGPQTCTVCQFEIAPVVPHDHIFDTNGTLHIHKCVCGQEIFDHAETCEICAIAHRQFPWYIICIVEAVIFGAVIAWLLLKKKKENTPPDDGIPAEQEKTDLPDAPAQEEETGAEALPEAPPQDEAEVPVTEEEKPGDLLDALLREVDEMISDKPE